MVLPPRTVEVAVRLPAPSTWNSTVAASMVSAPRSAAPVPLFVI
jgi:hypothetical protein